MNSVLKKKLPISTFHGEQNICFTELIFSFSDGNYFPLLKPSPAF